MSPEERATARRVDRLLSLAIPYLATFVAGWAVGLLISRITQ